MSVLEGGSSPEETIVTTGSRETTVEGSLVGSGWTRRGFFEAEEEFGKPPEEGLVLVELLGGREGEGEA